MRAGEPAQAVLTRFHGRDSGKEAGEDFYFAAKIHLGDTLFAAARSLPAGGVSDPVQQPDKIPRPLPMISYRKTSTRLQNGSIRSSCRR